MKRTGTVTLLILLSFSAFSQVSAVQPKVDERTELLSIVFRLAGSEEYVNNVPEVPVRFIVEDPAERIPPLIVRLRALTVLLAVLKVPAEIVNVFVTVKVPAKDFVPVPEEVKL